MNRKEENLKGHVIISTIQKLFAILTGQQLSEESEDAEDERNTAEEEKEDEPAVQLESNLKIPPDYFQLIIVDECQFLTENQIDQLRSIVNEENIPVMCFGLRTDFQTRLFPGSRRLMEVADTIQEIKTICDCGAKATVNARISDGYIVTEGAQVVLGGNDCYIAMCHKCYIKGIREHKKIKLHGQK